MRDLKKVLVEVKESWAEAGRGIDVRAALLKHREREFRILLAFGILTVACLGAATWLLVTDGVQAAKTFSGLAGLGGGGCLVGLLKAWKDWSRTDLLIILVDEAPKAQVAALMDKLIAKL
jgi:hypothetical protein